MAETDREDIPDTQPIEQELSNSCSSQLFIEPSPSPSCWGRLYPLSRSLQKHDLVETNVTFGTENCTFTLPKLLLEKRYVVSAYKKHFEIQRKTENFKGCRRTVVRLLDHSGSGLYVGTPDSGRSSVKRFQRSASMNGKVQSKILLNNDIISLPTNNFNGKTDLFRAFVYIDCFAAQLTHIPRVVHRKYQVSYKLGCGTFGEVYLVFNKSTGEPSAMKAIVQNNLTDRKTDLNRSKLLKEIEILKSLQHTHIIKCMDVLDIKNETFLFLEYMAGGDLSERIKQAGRLSEDLAKLFFYQICHGVKYLHDNNVIHRDIKPANVLMATNSKETIVKLTDFGLSKVLSSTIHMKTACGTKMYAAPELLSGKENRKYTSKVDVWSLGVLLFVSLSGKEPFAEQPHLMENQIRHALYVMDTQNWGHVSTSAKNFIDAMMTTNPDLRIGIEGVVGDEWLKDEDMLKKVKTLFDLFGGQLDLKFDVHSESPPPKKCKLARKM